MTRWDRAQRWLPSVLMVLSGPIMLSGTLGPLRSHATLLVSLGVVTWLVAGALVARRRDS